MSVEYAPKWPSQQENNDNGGSSTHWRKLRSSRGYVLTMVCFAIFTDVFLYGLLVPIIPFSLQTRAGIAERDVQHWVSLLLAIYGASLMVSSAFCGWISDRLGSRRGSLLGGLVALTVSMGLLCVGNSLAWLIAGRILQAMSTALVWTVSIALLVDTVGAQGVGKDIGFVSIASNTAVMAGPLLGGVVYEQAGYYSCFGMAFGLLAIDILLRLGLVEPKVVRRPSVIPGLDSETCLTKNGVVFPSSTNNRKDEEAPKDSSEKALCKIIAVASSQKKSIKRRWHIPPVISLLGSGRLLIALWATLVQASLYTSLDTVIPLYANETFGWHSTGGGVLFLCVMLPALVAPVFGWLSDKYGARWLATVGFLLGLPSYTLMRFVTHSGPKQVALLCVLLVLLGLSLTLGFTPMMAEIAYVIEDKERQQPGVFGPTGAYAQGYGLYNIAWAAGTLIGPVWSGYTKEAAGWGTMTWTLGLLCGITAFPVMIWTGGPIYIKEKRSQND